MLKLVTVLKKKTDMSVDKFQDYWLHFNGEIGNKLPGLVGYSQSHTLISAYKKITPIADGIAEYRFENVEDYRYCLNAKEFVSLEQDLRKFTDIQRNISITVQEREIKSNNVAPNGVKSIELVKRKKGMSILDFQTYWTKVHGPLGASIPQVNRYVQNHVTPESYGEEIQPVLDGLAVTWFDSTQDMRDSALTDEYRNTRSDEENFLTIPLEFIITEEHIFF